MIVYVQEIEQRHIYKHITSTKANQSLGDTRQLQKTVRARLTQLHTRVSVFLRGRTSTQVYSPFNFNPKVPRCLFVVCEYE
jgi:hypothetical protein